MRRKKILAVPLLALLFANIGCKKDFEPEPIIDDTTVNTE
jgi:hypothetical protein